MFRHRAGIFVLLLAGVLLCALGCARWWRAYEASRVVRQFLESVKSGNVAASLDALHPSVRSLAEGRANATDPAEWKSDSSLRFRLLRTTFSKDLATVEAWIEKDGYVVRPQFLLERDEQRHWKIVQIEGLRTDPLWVDRENKRNEADGEALFHELEQALADSPSIAAPPTDTDRVTSPAAGQSVEP